MLTACGSVRCNLRSYPTVVNKLWSSTEERENERRGRRGRGSGAAFISGMCWVTRAHTKRASVCESGSDKKPRRARACAPSGIFGIWLLGPFNSCLSQSWWERLKRSHSSISQKSHEKPDYRTQRHPVSLRLFSSWGFCFLSNRSTVIRCVWLCGGVWNKGLTSPFSENVMYSSSPQTPVPSAGSYSPWEVRILWTKNVL